jgi:U2-associated protein SR140
MAEEDDIQQFPDVKEKLAAPKKLSQFEKDRQFAEAKRRKEEEENAAVLREFEDEHHADEVLVDQDDMISHAMGGRGGRGPPSGPRGGPGGFGGGGGRFPMPRSGPGSLAGSGMGMPPSMKRKREMEEAREAEEARRAELGYEYGDDYQEGRSSAAVQEDTRDDHTPKPTVQLSSIPPGTSEQEIKALLAGLVKVHNVRLSSSTGQGKKSLTAIATLDASTSAAQIDKTVSTLRDRYMGCGFYLSISRHLSSAAQFQGASAVGGSGSFEPFGAQKNRSSNPRQSLRNAPPPHDHRGFAPPEHYDQRGPQARSASAQVEVHPPLDIATVRAIHTISGKILAQKDANRALEMEALLMTLPEVQKDERFAFLYDSKSPAGVYYRFCLWAPDSIDEQKRNAKGPERIFKDLDMDWLPPQRETPFLDLTTLAQAADHVDYDTSDDEADDDGDERKLNKGPGNEPDVRMAEKSRLSPMQRARFTRLLSRLPTSIARLRQGDISRVSNYVVNHAGGGAEEFVDLLLLNVEKPFSSTLAAKYDTDSGSDSEQDAHNNNSRTADEEEEDDYEPGDALPTLPPSSTNPPPTATTEDPSNPKLIALYTISDILSASSTAGARNAWKYRTLFETGLAHQKTFQNLGRLDKELGWGRLKAEQWKRKVGVVLSVWESWSVFSGGVLDGLKKDFYEPPLTLVEVEAEAVAAEVAKREEAKKVEEAAGWKSKFKKVESASPAPAPGAGNNGGAMDTRTDSVPTQANVSHARFKPVAGLDGASDVSSGQAALPTTTTPASSGGLSLKSGLKGPAVPKRRMRAEDMFGDSDDE